jgi:hypothetical protein
MSLDSILATLKADFQVLETDLVAFALKVQSGAEVALADAESALSALVANAGGLSSDLQTIDNWVVEFLPVAQAAGVPAADLSKVNSTLNLAKNIVTGLTAVQTAATSGAGNVGALVDGIAAYQQAQGAVSTLVATIAAVQNPAAAQVASPPTPPQA